MQQFYKMLENRVLKGHDNKSEKKLRHYTIKKSLCVDCGIYFIQRAILKRFKEPSGLTAISLEIFFMINLVLNSHHRGPFHSLS